MTSLLMGIVAALSLLFASPTPAQAQEVEIIYPVVIVSHVTTTTPEGYIKRYAAQYNVSESMMLRVLTCESGLNANAVGDYGTSFGVAQIHLPAHPDVSRSQALNAQFAIEWTAQQFALGKQTMWTCYRNIVAIK